MNVLKGGCWLDFLIEHYEDWAINVYIFMIKVMDIAIFKGVSPVFVLFFNFWITFAWKCGIDFHGNNVVGFHKFVGKKFSVVTLIMQVKSIFNGSNMFCSLGMVVGLFKG